MIEFRIKWAAAGAVYAGMLFGIIQFVVHSGKVGLPELAIGAFMGGAMALPLTACHIAAAMAVLLAAPRQSFAVQFALFAALSFGGWLLVIEWIDQALRSIGGVKHSETLFYLAFFLAGTGACLICMVVAARRTRQA